MFALRRRPTRHPATLRLRAPLNLGKTYEEVKMESQPTVALIIPTFRRGDRALAVARSLLASLDSARSAVVFVNDETGGVFAERPDERDPRILCVTAGTNLGPAGAMAYALRALAAAEISTDWLLRIDDDRPPTAQMVTELLSKAQRLKELEPQTGIVGLQGAVWNERMTRLSAGRGAGEVIRQVHYLKTGFLPLYHADVAKGVGEFRADFFFGLTEVEYGRRALKAGFVQWEVPISGHIYESNNHTGMSFQRGGWRRYYSVRNHIRLQMEDGRIIAAMSVALKRGLAAPLVACMCGTKGSLSDLMLSVRATYDAFNGKMGRVVDPFVWSSAHSRLTNSGEMPET